MGLGLGCGDVEGVVGDEVGFYFEEFAGGGSIDSRWSGLDVTVF